MGAYDDLIQLEPSKEFTTVDGKRYLRTGYCSRCGECCNSGDPFNGEEGAAVVAGACPIFRWLAGQEGVVGECSNRLHKYYLAGCQYWPSKPQHIANYPSCTYVFTEITG